MPDPQPTLDVPPPLRGSDDGSFAEHTVRSRLHDILRRTVEENDFHPLVKEHLAAMDEEIPDAPVRTFIDDGNDVRAWLNALKPHRGHSWLEVPWFFAETYFYRRILNATGYFGGWHTGVDPFAHQKQTAYDAHEEAISDLAAATLESRTKDVSADEALMAALSVALWGNRADLSLWPADGTASGNHAQSDDAILADDRAAFVEWIGARAPLQRVDVIVDNTGFELVCDLVLAYTLLAWGLADLVLLHAKAHPTFVSDAISADVYALIDELGYAESESTQAFADALQGCLQKGQIGITDHFFWNSPHPAWDLPAPLHEALSDADLLITKGDANYRRLLGDRHWDYTTPFQDVVGYRPAPLLALRTLKSEVVVGLDEATIQQAAGEDDDWLVSGKRGIIQFAP